MLVSASLLLVILVLWLLSSAGPAVDGRESLLCCSMVPFSCR